MIELFEHNKTAYDAAVSMLAEEGRAAVIHPTGTGKSFIGFKLCEDHPDKTVMWLSPSEYIFGTQKENLIASGAEVPSNIVFCTYAKLMLTDDKTVADLRPDYIILDEFHRCGAKMWGAGVMRLLKACPDAPVLGLSATNIRYLDGRRDMADELFGGNVASEMTLGEAIVRGILKPPKYVTSVFSCAKSLEKYERRVRGMKSGAARKNAERYLETLRRALEKADGLDSVFGKHMINGSGRYIVFCPNREGMDSYISLASEWFSKVDTNPHIYRAYSDDHGSDRQFAEFKADQSEHLKLLYCIDMLNEGVHVEGINGVILLRPTASPIIYRQQIGRAFAAGKRDGAVIFDIVLNIEGLCGISAVEEEMAVAMTYYRFNGEGEEIVADRFVIEDEVRDCVELFGKLNEALSASWDVMYGYAKKYYVKHGNLEVPRRYRTPDGYSLGSWIHAQRRIRAGEQGGRLGPERIKKLDDIGMVWGNTRDLTWERNYEAAKEYRKEHGDLLVPADTPVLGPWIANMRTYRKSGIRRGYLTDKRITMLDEIGMVWDVPDYIWERNYGAALAYFREHGNLDVPAGYTRDGVRLGAWLNAMRAARRGEGMRALPTPEQIAKLDGIGMVWDKSPAARWERSYDVAAEYAKEHGNIDVPSGYVTKGGVRLGAWVCRQRERYKSGAMTKEQKERLEAIGMTWSKGLSWESRFAEAKRYYEEHGNLRVPAGYRAGGMCLSKWLNEQKQIYRGNRPGKSLSDDRIKMLESVGIEWEGRVSAAGRVA